MTIHEEGFDTTLPRDVDVCLVSVLRSAVVELIANLGTRIRTLAAVNAIAAR